MDSNSFIQLPELNFPEKYQFRLRKSEDEIQIFCPLRKKWLLNTPEEWVRQHVIHYLNQNYHYPFSALIAEFPVKINQLNQRIDIMIVEKSKPKILVECKKPGVEINQTILNQALRYAQQLKLEWIYLTNGFTHHFFTLNHEDKKVDAVENLPFYKTS